MTYSDGNDARIGDEIQIDTRYWGTVVANLDLNQFCNEYPNEQWSYLGCGVLVLTDFAGLVHYSSSEQEHIRLIARAKI